MKLMTYRQVGRQALEEHWVYKNSYKCVDRWGLEMDEQIVMIYTQVVYEQLDSDRKYRS